MGRCFYVMRLILRLFIPEGKRTWPSERYFKLDELPGGRLSNESFKRFLMFEFGSVCTDRSVSDCQAFLLSYVILYISFFSFWRPQV